MKLPLAIFVGSRILFLCPFIKRRYQRLCHHRSSLALLFSQHGAAKAQLGMVVFFVLFGIALGLNARVQHQVAMSVLRAEKKFSWDLKKIKRYLGVEARLSQEELFDLVVAGDKKTVTLFLGAGIDPNLTGSSGLTPLAIASATAQPKMVELLLSYHANPNVRDAKGLSPLMYAVGGCVEWGDEFETICPIIDWKTKETQVGEVANKLLQAGADVNAVDNSGHTALTFAVSLNSLTKDSQNAKETQLEREESEIVEILLDHGAHPEETKKEDFSTGAFSAREKTSPQDQSENEENAAEDAADQDREQEQAGSSSSTIEKAPSVEDAQNGDNNSSRNAESGNTEQATTPTPFQDSPTPAVEGPSVYKLTRLRATSKPIGEWHRSKYLSLNSVKVPVKNVGDETANDVRVAVVLSGGRHVNLEGPTSLLPKESATYSATQLREVITNYQTQLTSEVTCANCWK